VKIKISKNVIVFIVIIVIFAPLIGIGMSMKYDECSIVKEEYEQNKQLATEKYRYESFDEWRESDGRDFSPNCIFRIF